MRRFPPFFFLLTLIITACGPVTPVPTETAKRNAGPTSMVTTFGLPEDPKLEVIASENIGQIQQIDRLGTGPILGVATSPGKDRIAVAIPGQIIIYDAATLAQKQTISEDFDDYAPVLRFSPDGQTLVFSDKKSDQQSSSYAIKFLDLISGKLKRSFASVLTDWQIRGIELSPEGERLIVYTVGRSARCEESSANLALYDLDGNLLLDRYYCSRYHSEYYGFTTDGKAYFSVMTEVPVYFDLLDAKTGVLIESSTYQFGLKAPAIQKMLYRITPDGNTLAYATFKDHSITTELVDFKTRKVLQTSSGLLEFLVEDGKINWMPVVQQPSSYVSPRIVLETCNLRNPIGPNYYTLISSNGKKAILTISHTSTVESLELWNLTTCKVENTISFPSAQSNSVFSPNGRWLAASDGYTAYVWSMETRKLHFSVPGKMFFNHQNAIQFNADGTRFLTGSQTTYYIDQAPEAYTISSFNSQTGKLVQEMKPKTVMLQTLMATPDKDIILSIDASGFHFWNIETGQLLSDLPHGSYAFASQSGQIWIAQKNEEDLYQIVLCDYQTGRKLRAFEPVHAQFVKILFVTNTQKMIVSLQQTETQKVVSMIDLESETTLFSSTLDLLEEFSVASQNGFVTYEENGYIYLWNFVQKAPYLTLLGNYQNKSVNDFMDGFGGGFYFSDVQFLNENILVANAAGTIRFWDTKKGILLSEIKPDYQIIGKIAIGPTQQLMAVTGRDGIIRLWGVPKP